MLNFLGIIVSTVHSTRRHAHEIHNNLKLLRSACIELDLTTYNVDLESFVRNIQSSKRTVLSSRSNSDRRNVKLRTRDENQHALSDIRGILRRSEIHLYKSCYLSTNRFTTVMHCTTRQKNDSCVLFRLGGKMAIGFIVNIIQTDEKELLFRINRVWIRDQLRLVINSNSIACSNVYHGNIDSHSEFVYVKPQSVVEKLIHVYDAQLKAYIFFRVPNLCESS